MKRIRRAADTYVPRDQRSMELPELAIQRIQSFLPTEAAARSCVLSKSWLRSFSTHPCLDFDQSLLFGVHPLYHHFNQYHANDKYPGGIEQVRNKFVDFVNTTLVRYTTQKLRILKFRLSATMLDADHLMDEWIRMAIESGTNELHLLLSPSYTLPETIFSTKSLEVLHLSECNCCLREINNHDVRPRQIDFCNLKKLVLRLVYIDDHTIASFISGSPFVETINLHNCRGFTRMKVTSNLDHLKVFEMTFARKGQILDIEAPNLESFKFSGILNSVRSDDPPLFYMINHAFSKLKELRLAYVNITDTLFNDLVRRFKVIQVLSLSHCNKLKSINISGGSLRVLSISCCSKLVAVTVDHAPQLRKFQYYTCDKLAASISVVNCSRELEIYVVVTGCVDNLDHTSWFLQLRGFLKNINHPVKYLSVLLKLGICFNLDPSQAADHSCLAEVADLKVDVKQSADSDSSSSSTIWPYAALLDCLFWTCHPTETLTIAWGGTNSDIESKRFSEFLGKNQTQYSNKYWWRCLNDAKISNRPEDSEFMCDLRRDSIWYIGS